MDEEPYYRYIDYIQIRYTEGDDKADVAVNENVPSYWVHHTLTELF